MYALALGPAALGLVHTYQANHSRPCYIYNMYILLETKIDINIRKYNLHEVITHVQYNNSFLVLFNNLFSHHYNATLC